MESSRQSCSVLVIGAGPAGLAAAKCLTENGHRVTVFEKTDELGGIWVFRPGHYGGAYKNTRFQSSKFTSHFSDFPFEEEADTFPTVKDVNRYLHRYAETFELKPLIRYRHEVSRLAYDGTQWEVVFSSDSGSELTETYDAVAICSGCYWSPLLPEVSGLESFTGEIVHSSNYHDTEILKGKRVLIVGNGVSGMDIVAEVAETSEQVSWSLRKKNWIMPRIVGFIPNDCTVSPIRRAVLSKVPRNQVLEKWRASMPDFMRDFEDSGLLPEHSHQNSVLHINDNVVSKVAKGDIDIKPAVSRIEGDMVHYVDGSSQAVDAIVFCTGYHFSSPDFLPELSIENGLYEGVFHPDLPKLAYIGNVCKPVRRATTNIFPVTELQSRWFSHILSGELEPPLRSVMLDALERWEGVNIDELYPISLAEKFGAFPDPRENWSLYWELLNMPSYPSLFRLQGPNPWPQARQHIDAVKAKTCPPNFITPEIEQYKYVLLSRLGKSTLEHLFNTHQIDENELNLALSVSNGEPSQAAERQQSGDVAKKVKSDLKELIFDILKIEPDTISSQQPWLSMGFDSITLTRLANQINQCFPCVKLSPAAFLQHATLDELVVEIAAKHQEPESDHGLPSTGSNKTESQAEVSGSNIENDPNFLSWLGNKIYELLKVDITEENLDTPLVALGFDSISLTRLANEINRRYKDLAVAPSIFIEYPTVSALSAYLSQDFAQELAHTQDNREEQKEQERREYQKAEQTNPQKQRPTRNGQIDDIAIVGIAGRFPGSEDIGEFWRQLKEGHSMINLVPQDRWDWKKIYGAPLAHSGKTDCNYGGFIRDAALFDPLYFNISPSEARLMDPQQRIFLEVVELCLQNAGYSREAMNGSHTGVYVGVARLDYAGLITDSNDRTHGYANTGNTHAILANRVSYIYGWTGESLAIDCACSSSSLAIHKAVRAISSGECEQAVAGGVNLILSPTTFISNRKMGLLSNESSVRSFDQKASGYLSGEGAGAVLLKPLSRALADGDFVYAVIKGSAVRHCGHGASLTTPNPKMQAQVIRDAYADAGIPPSKATYIEAQGAGNVMGDSAELSAYHDVFDTDETAAQSIGVGSIKGNIGHLETASGVVALIKLLLAMKNQQMPPMLHADECQSYFAMDKGPFFFPSNARHWKSSTDNPVIASLHNFGYGGVNVHLVLQDYRRPTPPLTHRSEPCLIAFSAASQSQLRQYLNSIRDYLTNPGSAIYNAEPTLNDIAFTLLHGRPQLSTRVHFIVSSMAELIDGIGHYLSGEKALGASTSIDPISIDVKSIPVSQGGHPMLDGLSRDERLLALAEFWRAGNIIDWQRYQLHRDGRRTPLPCPGFDKAFYWAGNIEGCSGASTNPMLGHNCSTTAQPQYRIKFTGNEFFFADHRVGEDKILPGVAHLEMVRSTGEDTGLNVVVMKNIMWGQPIIIRDQSLEVACSIRVKDEATQSHHFELHSGEKLYCKGTILNTDHSISTPNQLRVEALMKSFDRILEHNAIYDQFGLRGLHLGPAFRPLRKLWFNSEQALGQLEIPTEISSSSKDFYLHPSIMDGALQTITALVSGELSNRLYLPFSLGKICVYAPVNEPCYALSRRLQNQSNQDNSLLHFNITLIAGDGRVLAELTEFCVRLWKESPEHEDRKGFGLTTPELMLARVDSKPTNNHKVRPIADFFDCECSLLAIDIGQNSVVSDRLPAKYKPHPHFVHWSLAEGKIQDCITSAQLSFKSDDDICRCIEELLAGKALPSNILLTMPAIAEDPGRWIFERVFTLLKSLVSRVKNETRLICIDTNQTVNPWNKATSSFLKSLSKESPQLKCRYVHFQGVTDKFPPIEAILAEFFEADTDDTNIEADICTEGSVRRYECLRALDVSTLVVDPLQSDSYRISPFKHGGVYLITGGMGKLGVIFARHLAAHGDVRLVLAGSSPMDEGKLKVIRELESQGAGVRYFRTDFSNRSSVSEMLSAAQECFGSLTGIFHCAGRTDDDYLINKRLMSTASVVNPKAQGAMLLDELTGDHSLDFFVMASSLTSVAGNAGQTDYAYANGFLDSFAAYRNSQVEAGKRSGLTLSINWPLWQDGGMTLATAQLEWLEQNLGLLPMPTSEGLKALDYGLLNGLSRLVVLYGHKPLLINQFNLWAPEQALEGSISESENQVPDTFDFVRETVLQLFSKKSGIPAESIDATKHLSSYGMDSMMVMELTRSLENDFSDIPGTLFFEHPTIDAVAGYLCEKHQGKLDSLMNRRSKEPSKQILNTLPSGEEGLTSISTLLQNLPVESQIQQIPVSPEVKLETISLGQGSPLLFIPGFGMTAKLWFRQLEYFAEHHRIVIVHPPAHGESDAADDVSPSTIAHYLVKVLKALKIHEPVDVVGTSFGGQIAQCLAAVHGSMVKTLTIANSFYELKDRFSPTDPLAGSIVSVGGDLWQEFNDQSLQDNATLHKDYLMIKGSIGLDSANALTYIDGFTRTSTREMLKDIKAPTLIISGSEDRLSNRDVNSTLHESLLGSRFHCIEGAGHFACVTHHREFNEIVNQFISRHQEKASGKMTYASVD
ncbi:hypothetical protein BTA51_26145 [Hahella sp. CCB-MM4]|uniref:alpha/beta fold hydrolase n=1 Tax=Hahella sp. (strain CCB-MM4) TaxID=1926491 RepID=UPI000B9C10CA|nr:alpha/beta fold hydrolase [Hahella sp. CCB-MM4]OZG70452.1 hypothetical protein BTA51_26145 [Hahella sp. CCB-MM4]